MLNRKENPPKAIHKVWVLVNSLSRTRVYDVDKFRIIDMDLVGCDTDDWTLAAISDPATQVG
jgi:hypothetical protein